MNSTAIPSSRLERSLIVGCAVLAAILVVVGFGESYYFKLWNDAPALSVLLHAHGAIMTLWFVLFCVQVALVETRRVNWHRKLGVFGACLAAAIVLSGALVVWTAAVRETALHAPDAHFFLILLGFDWFFLLPVFAILVGTAVVYRRRPDVHKRLMLIATLSLLGPAISRLPISWISDNPANALWVIDVVVIACVAVDSFNHRRLHSAFAWSAAVVVVGQHLAFFAFTNRTWIGIASRMIQSP